MNDEAAKRVKARVNPIAGQVAGIQRMVEVDRYCVEILNQIAAARSALDSLGIEILTKHLEICVLGRGSSTVHPKARPMTKDQLVDEVRKVLGRFLK